MSDDVGVDGGSLGGFLGGQHHVGAQVVAAVFVGAPGIKAGKCPHDWMNDNKNDKHCSCQQQKGCV